MRQKSNNCSSKIFLKLRGQCFVNLCCIIFVSKISGKEIKSIQSNAVTQPNLLREALATAS